MFDETVAAGLLVWAEGMAEWVPIGEAFHIGVEVALEYLPVWELCRAKVTMSRDLVDRLDDWDESFSDEDVSVDGLHLLVSGEDAGFVAFVTRSQFDAGLDEAIESGWPHEFATQPTRDFGGGYDFEARERERSFLLHHDRLYELLSVESTPLQNDADWDSEAFVAEWKQRRVAYLQSAIQTIEALEAQNPSPDPRLRYRSQARERISKDVQMFVWQRDGGRCAMCGSRAKLEFDHIIPLAMGGGNTARNLQLLCEPCNRGKGPRLA
jgi:hypothetical protein